MCQNTNCLNEYTLYVATNRVDWEVLGLIKKNMLNLFKLDQLEVVRYV